MDGQGQEVLTFGQHRWVDAVTDSAEHKHTLGRQGETLARRYLKKLGYRYIARNFSCRQGEIDLIMRQDETVVFVEVKTRRDEQFATGEEAIHFGKQKKLAATARDFIQTRRLHEHPCRFDSVAVVLSQEGQAVIRHQKNVFVPRH